jgi:IS605 OrfB family transposase
LSKEDYVNLKTLSHSAKNLYNEALYNVRQYYFAEKEYLNYEKNYALLKSSENYKNLNSNMAQQILKEVDGAFKSFFGLIERARKGGYDYRSISLPHYLPKDGNTTLVIGFVRLNGNKLIIPYSNSFRKEHKAIIITMPPILREKKIKEIRIIPKSNARFFEVQYTYEANEQQREINKENALAIDLGLDNLTTCVTSAGKSFIIDGRRIKSINQWYNKQNTRLQGIKDKQNITGTTARQSIITNNRNNAVNDYINKTCRYIVNYCLSNDIGNIVIGYNETLQKDINLGKRTNQNFVNIPVANIKLKLEYLCKLYGINFVKQEESYTSKASFFDGDEIPKYNHDNPKEYQFSGKRIERGLYRTASGYCINADVNGALNILKKSSVVSLLALYGRGAVDTPVRIRIS